MKRLSINNLRGKQSVRVTFQLVPEAIDLLTVMATQLGLKQKTLFDQLMKHHEMMATLAEHDFNQQQGQEKRRQKTFVLSQETVETLNHLADQYHAPRNVLVEMSIRRLLPILALEQQKHEKRKILLGALSEYLQQEKKLGQYAEDILGQDDPVVQEMAKASQAWQQSYEKIMEIIEKGKEMENLQQSTP